MNTNDLSQSPLLPNLSAPVARTIHTAPGRGGGAGVDASAEYTGVISRDDVRAEIDRLLALLPA